MALQQRGQPNFVAWYKKWNYGTFAWVPPVFGWAAITLGIGPHSSVFNMMFFISICPLSTVHPLFSACKTYRLVLCCIISLWPPYVIGQAIIFLPCGFFFFLLLSFAESTKKSPSGHHRTTLSGCIFGTKACIDNRKKNLLNSNTSSTCPDNMVNFGPLAAEIGLPV